MSIRKMMVVLAVLAAAMCPQMAQADAVVEGSKFVDKLSFSGDFRVRHESFFNKTAGMKDRDRERFRMRFGVKAEIQDFTVNLRLASGTGEQVSTNQTFGNLYSEKGIFIDQAYATWKAREFLTLVGGRMANPFWRTYASDIMWDDDVNPEGYAEQLQLPVSDRLKVFVNLAQLPLHENSAIEADPWMFGNQVGGQVLVSEDTSITMAGSYYAFINERLASLAPGVQQQGNTRVGAGPQLATQFTILMFTGELKTHVGPAPLSLQGDFVRNTEDLANQGSNGYQTGVVVGRAKAAGSMEFAYFYKYLQNNATLADLSDSDFGNGGTNRKGHILWLAYNPREYVQLKVKYFLTRTLNPFISTTGGATTPPNHNFNDINRLQCDVSIKF